MRTDLVPDVPSRPAAGPAPRPVPAHPVPPASRGSGVAGDRDRAIDAYRAFAMFVVVAWHWVFTIPRWRADGPHVDNPISFVPELAYLTWLLQVMPLFFLVGGHLTARATAGLTTTGERLAWARRRAGRLVRPALPLLVLLGVLYVGARLAGQPAAARAIVLTASPLWFLGSYLAVTATVPLLGGVARRFPVGHVVALVAWCVLWDLARFGGVLDGSVLWLSMVVVWVAVHQVGTLLDRVDRGRALLLGGGSLVVLWVGTHLGPYPVSMVGTTSDEVSNMGPATAVLLALAGVQLAVVALSREVVGRFADRHAVRTDRLASYAMPVYVWHMVGFSACVFVVALFGLPMPEQPTLAWWLARPLWVLGPLLVAWPLVRAAATRPRPLRRLG